MATRPKVSVRLFVCIAIAISVLIACIPTTARTINLGAGYGLSEMDRVESILEGLGFSRIMFEPKGMQPAPRAKYDDEWVSGFETIDPRGYGASVHWRIHDGSLRIAFAERNTKLSAEGEKLLQNLVGKLREAYGIQVYVEPKT